MSPNNISKAKFSLFSEIAYDLSNLIRGGIAVIVNPNDNSFFISPSINWSVKTNLDLFATMQIFEGNNLTEFGNKGNLIALRLKYSY